MFPHVTDDRGLGHKRACKPLQKTASLIDETTQPSVHRQASIYIPKLHHDDSKFHNKSKASYMHRFNTVRIQTFSGNIKNNPTTSVRKVTYMSQEHAILLPSGYFSHNYVLVLMQ